MGYGSNRKNYVIFLLRHTLMYYKRFTNYENTLFLHILEDIFIKNYNNMILIMILIKIKYNIFKTWIG